MKGAYALAKKYITDNSAALVRIAEALLEREVLDANEIQALLDGRDLPPIGTTDTPEDTDADKQEVLRPEPPNRVPDLSEGEQTSPA